ncbi:hypothetical protein CNO14_04190 [Borrelia miyamotoi]|uniref:Uncharacterized protein n=1 Tax=Borrelia miyamotoi TaxID=47466 RepID=A0AAP9CG58_9SPIR|nr:hypothetical protein [Borrelia miyamotoi]AHH05403.1 Hypothetical protein BOM_0860 [Borrelia miyamotoi FR64b]ATQ15160.1 hypothetical protein CNO14_04190 [Borrelia miyamotoi]ATQ16342.1 hypothetical protein CNO13_04190 [Borrelia miyamotoi]ATQ17485.1 hypothetical protein CNO12_04195 [Borrelia miyamotoi]ATQ18012.1 hypothetical protein CNO11_00060 [Borrelia miyamotoi]
MNKSKLFQKLILLKMLENNISGNIYGKQEEKIETIKHKIIKARNIKILKNTKQKDIKGNKRLIESIENKTNKKDLLIIYIDKKYLNQNVNIIVKKWCDSINIFNYKIIDNPNTLNLEINNKQPKAILACEEVELFLNQKLRIQIVRGFELNFKGIPIVFTYLPTSQIKNPKLKEEIWQDLKIIKGIIKYG